ncbi:MAG: S9 family peptidase [Steroidobacteraceae bacterium]
MRLSSFHALLTTLLLGATALATPLSLQARPFTYQDLVRLDRISALSVSPDAHWALFQVRTLNKDETRGEYSIWLRDLTDLSRPETKLAVSDGGASDPAFSPDGRFIYFMSDRSSSAQVWRTTLAGATAVQVTKLPLDVNGFRVTPDGKHIVVVLAVDPAGAAAANGGDEIAYTLKSQEARKAQKTSGVVYDKLFVRHWDTWADGTRNHLFRLDFDSTGVAVNPVALMPGFDADVFSKPDGDIKEIDISPDSQWLYFGARLAGKSEPWSTNFDVYVQNLVQPGALRDLTADNQAWDATPRVSPDGRTLAYRAMKRPAFEADRFWLYLRDLQSGTVRALAADWDRSADDITWSKDGRSLWVTADDLGTHRLFRIDARSGAVTPVTRGGHLDEYAETASGMVFAKSGLGGPTQLYLQGPQSRGKERSALIDAAAQPLTQINAQRLAGVEFGAFEQFSFEGWNDETVYGYVMKPAGYVEGRRYPVAFIVHGGPQSSFSDAWSYRWNAQSYAGEGFGVVFIDFHGSPGYGQAFTDSISQHWGDRPLEDLKKGYAAALAQYPFLDASRACALGASYGGYMINWIAGNWKEPWKCLVEHDGLFDTRFMGYATEELWFAEWENGGPAYSNPQKYDEFNPALHAANWSVPMLVVHSDHDYRVVPDEGIATFTTLQRMGIESKFLRFPDENHWVLKPQNSLLWHQTVMGWIKQHTGGTP